MQESSDVVQVYTPSEHYFWYRKRREAARLVLSHRDQIWRAGAMAAADIGCGTGLDLAVLGRILGVEDPNSPWSLSGVDGHAPSLEQARGTLASAGLTHITLQRARLDRRLPFDDGSLRLTYCSEVIEHMLDPDAFLAELFRIIEPGGFLLLTTPNQPNVFQRSFWSRRRRDAVRTRELAEPAATLELDGETFRVLRHVSLRTVGEWRMALQQTGFTIVGHRRGALFYGSRPVMDTEWFIALQSAAEAFLDLWPVNVTRALSDQVIVLARRP